MKSSDRYECFFFFSVLFVPHTSILKTRSDVASSGMYVGSIYRKLAVLWLLFRIIIVGFVVEPLTEFIVTFVSKRRIWTGRANCQISSSWVITLYHWVYNVAVVTQYDLESSIERCLKHRMVWLLFGRYFNVRKPFRSPPDIAVPYTTWTMRSTDDRSSVKTGHQWDALSKSNTLQGRLISTNSPRLRGDHGWPKSP